MGRHDWVTRRNSRSRYAVQLEPSLRPEHGLIPDLPTTARAAGPDQDDPQNRRTRWKIGSAAACVAAGLTLGLVFTLWIGGAFGEPVRNVTEVKTGPMTTRSGSSSWETADYPGHTTGTQAKGAGSPVPSAAELAPAGIQAPAAAKPTPRPVRIVVHVAGAVKEPGIVSLDKGSRIHEAISAAGGAATKAQLSAVNLAAQIQDGQQLYVPTRAEVSAGPAPAPPGSGAAEGALPGTAGSAAGAGEEPPTVNINTASAELLSTLPGVGPVLSGRIVEWREEHGSFATVDELDAVSGIGEKMLATLRELVTL
ncbi:helix-hairpin-helix domain-containing protein [Arthrobacter sp. H14]|uniref:helix-hairpin-helix domain-containing protein n=1 Tax=Arthrobacter sp. H14 TaxID=1312959 RepID=UPI0004AECC29|nr:helix-hairpin-helix domain-containing protein [Arthrobacter sp. H14]